MQLYHQHRKTARRALQALFRLFAPFYRRKYQTNTSGYNTACTTLERITAPGRPPAHTRYHRHAGRCTGHSSRPIIIRYIRVQRCALLWIHARRCSRSQTVPARRGQLLLCVDRWQVLHPAHLLRGQRLHLYRVSPAPSTRRGSPAAGARRAARNY